MGTLIDQLRKDVRFIEGLNSCINCGSEEKYMGYNNEILEIPEKPTNLKV